MGRESQPHITPLLAPLPSLSLVLLQSSPQSLPFVTLLPPTSQPYYLLKIWSLWLLDLSGQPSLQDRRSGWWRKHLAKVFEPGLCV